MDETIIPPREVPETDDGYLEQMAKAIFQAGFNWKVVENKWPHIRRVFEDFAVDLVAEFDVMDVDRLTRDPGMIRNARKIKAVIANAKKVQALRGEHQSFHGYLRSLDGKGYPEISRELQKRFDHLGRTGTFVFLWCVGEDVPRWEDR